MIEIKAPSLLLPQEIGGHDSLFMAGGISNCPDWQSDMLKQLKGVGLIVFNPRRNSFDMTDLKVEEDQIKWEYFYLNQVKAVSFWFPKETLCPITLYELGAAAKTDKILFVGCHPEYARIRDVRIQLSLIRPKVQVVTSIKELTDQIRRKFNTADDFRVY